MKNSSQQALHLHPPHPCRENLFSTKANARAPTAKFFGSKANSAFVLVYQI
jgi:hypothetical protein